MITLKEKELLRKFYINLSEALFYCGIHGARVVWLSLCLGYTTDTLFLKHAFLKLCFFKLEPIHYRHFVSQTRFRNFVFQTVADTLQTLCFANARNKGK